MSLKELKLIFPKISDAPSPSDRDAYFLFALALWRDSSGEERQEWWCDDWLVRCGGGSVRVETKSRQHQQYIRVL